MANSDLDRVSGTWLPAFFILRMNILTWNCQGIANRRTRHALKDLIQQHRIHLVFLSETHCTKKHHETLPRALGLPHIAHFDRISRAGGVAMLWSDDVVVQIRSVEYFFIDVDIVDPGGTVWRFTGFYGHPETNQRHFTWDLLRSLKSPLTDLWLVAGDFNEILSSSEKSGGSLRSNSQIALFRDALTDCGLEDLGSVGGQFTWSNNFTKERLDRGVCSDAWRNFFSYSRVVTLAPSRSDHNPLLIEIRNAPDDRRRRRRRFRFEEIWASHSSFPQVVEELWSQPQMGAPMLQICRKITDTGKQLLA